MPSAEGFVLTYQNANRTIQISRNDIAQDGATLRRRRREQIYDTGSSSVDLLSFGAGLELAIDGQAPISMTASNSGNRFLRIRLNAAERAQCLNQADFQVDVAVTGPTANAFTALTGGILQVYALDAVFARARGGACPRDLFYGYTFDLGVDGAISDSGYQGDIDITVTGPSGTPQILTSQMAVDMPSILLLYHFDRVDVNVQAAALTELMAPAGPDLGATSITLASLQVPVDVDIEGAVPPVSALTPTITLQNAVAARAIGCAGGIYGEASYVVRNTSGGILPGAGIINDIQGRPCSFSLLSGDVEFELDLNVTTFNGPAPEASAEIQVTITGL